MVTSSNLVLRFSETEQQVINELVNAQVHFIIIGGHAVVLHGHKRIVNDLDVWIEPSAENVSRLTAAVSRLGYTLLDDSLARLQRPHGQLTLGIWSTDVLSSVESLDFGECFVRASDVDAGGQVVKVLSRADLITSKSGSDREKDLADLAVLRNDHSSLG